MDTPETIAADYLRRGASVDIGSAISRGWALVRDNAGVLIGASVLGWVVTLALAVVPIVGWMLGFVLVGGLDYVFIRRIRGEAVDVGDVFAGFNLAFANLVLAGLMVWLLTTLGFLLCILPGIYLVVGYVFVPPLVIDKKMDFWPAMEVSRQVVHRALVVDVRARACARARSGRRLPGVHRRRDHRDTGRARVADARVRRSVWP